MSEVILARLGDKVMNKEVVNGMFRLRHSVFHDRLGWDVSSESEMERDEFDQCNPVYTLVKGDSQKVEGCWRLLPTTGTYMLKDVFPCLLHGKPAPQHPKVWEISRFALSKFKREDGGFSFCEVAVRMLRSIVDFADQQGVEHYVMVTTVAVERLMRKLGLEVHRFGPPMRIGSALSVACWFSIDSNTRFVAFGRSPNNAVIKEAA